MTDPAAPPLCIDLDGTLIRSDLLADGLAALLARPTALLSALTRLPDRAALKARVAALAPLRPELLPYDQDLLARLRAERATGRHLVLATAADGGWARQVAAHLGLVDEVIATAPGHNLKGRAKAAALVARFGDRGFDYAGNAPEDLHVWQHARQAWVVGAPAGLAEQAARLAPVAFSTRRAPLAAGLLAAIRPHQWMKNMLVFVPVLTSHALLDLGSWLGGLLAFGAFSATASAIYLLNDLTDIDADRAHPQKSARPFAAGRLPVPAGLLAAAGLVLLGLALGFFAGMLVPLLVYAAASVLYSLRLKELPLVDVFVLSGLYTIRIIGGGSASGHHVTLWLLGFSAFMFLGLAFMKRVEELRGASGSLARRGYTATDLPVLAGFGIAASFASCILLTLFVQSDTVGKAYAAPAVLWAIVPLMLFWQCRLWLYVARGYMHHDPLVYALRDWVSWVVGGAVLAVITAAAASPG